MEILFVAPGAEADVVLAPVFNEGDDFALSPAAEALNTQLDGRPAAAAKAARFTGKPGRVLDLAGETPRVVLWGLGARDGVNGRVVEKAAAAAVRALLERGPARIQLHLDGLGLDAATAARAGLGARLGAYRFDRYRTKMPADKKPTLEALALVVDDVAQAQEAWTRCAAIADGVTLARDLVTEPPNVLHPEEFARRVRALSDVGVEVEILGEAEMERLNMGALLGVGRGSRRESQLAVMRWNGGEADAAPVAFIGKGVTFDTGGVSLKPSNGMDEMKGDMGGAAAVVGALRALAQRKAKANVLGVVGLVENMPDGDAIRPGDVLTSMSGQTIEVLNTDAEGRLVLADAIWYAQDRFKPKLMVDLATLTGAMIITLAHEYAGVLSPDDALVEQLTAAGAEADEPLWRLPMGDAYDRMIDSKIADMKNIGGRFGGSITAAQFIKRFVKDTPWAHLDIASTAWKSKNDDPREPAWATGWGVRLLERFVADHHEG